MSCLNINGQRTKSDRYLIWGAKKYLGLLDSGACPGPDPGFAGMTEKLAIRTFYNSVNTNSLNPEMAISG